MQKSAAASGIRFNYLFLNCNSSFSISPHKEKTPDDEKKEPCQGDECFAKCKRVCGEACVVPGYPEEPKKVVPKKIEEPAYNLTQADIDRVVSVKDDAEKKLLVIRKVLRGVKAGTPVE